LPMSPGLWITVHSRAVESACAEDGIKQKVSATTTQAKAHLFFMVVPNYRDEMLISS
jgi:hypothetical protein